MISSRMEVAVRLAPMFAASLLAAAAFAQSAPSPVAAPSTPAAVPSTPGTAAPPSGAAASGAPAPAAKLGPALATPRSQRGEMWYAARYGVDHLQVRSVSSGMSLEFRYRVLNPDKAHILGDKNAKPALVDWKTGTRLTVPTMEKIGQLRQEPTKLEQGREYWMVFANPGKLVKPRDKVDVVVGPIRLEGLIVE
jgi:hypothetical protein